jgi:hypothetical protein
MQIDYSDPVNRALVVLTCGDEFVPPEHVVRETVDDCEAAAIALGGALSRYCGCPCRHPEEPICNPNLLPEQRAANLYRTFAEFTPEMRGLLSMANPENNFSFATLFDYCPDEVGPAYDRLLAEHILPAPRDPEACRVVMDVDTDFLNRPAGLWIPFDISIGVLPDEHFLTPWHLRLGIVGYHETGFFGGGYASFSIFPTRSPNTPEGISARQSNMVYSVGLLMTAGYYIWISESFGIQIHADLEPGGHWSSGEVLVREGEWVDSIGDFYIDGGGGIDMMLWFLEGFAMLLGIEYLANFIESQIPRHSLEFSMKFQFRGY